MSSLRQIAQDLARKDREHLSQLVRMRREAGVTQTEIDKAFGADQGWAAGIEAYWSDPTLSDLRRYEAYVTHEWNRTRKS